MREPMIVDHAQHAPNACSCGNTHGPLLDTFFESNVGRVYVCKRCAKSYARAFGFAEGKRMDELSDAAGLVEGKDVEIAGLQDRLVRAEEVFRAGMAESGRLRSELEDVVGRLAAVAHVAESVGADVGELLGLLGVGAAEGELVAA